MTMNKNILFAISLFCAIFIFNSCLKDDDDYFDDSASERIEKEVVHYRELLVKPQNGWIMEYYPGGINQTYGGYALSVKFNDKGTAVVQSSLNDDVTRKSVGSYSIKKDNGATLNFDTENEFLHYFSSPDEMAGGGISEGMLGDYEFIFKSSTDNSIVLEGKKHSSKILLYALDESSDIYLEKARKNRISYDTIPGVKSLTGIFGGALVTGELISPQQFLLTQNEEQAKVTFMFTDKGVKLYNPVTLNGKTLEELVWNIEEQAFSSPDGSVKLNLELTPFAVQLKDLLGKYSFKSARVNVDDVEIYQDPGNKRIYLRGLPFGNVQLTYNTKKGALELKVQQMKYSGVSDDIRLCIWDADTGYFQYGVGSGYGVVTRWNGDKDNMILDLVDNGFEWIVGGAPADADGFLLYNMTKGSAFTQFGEYRYIYMQLIRKK